jgi:hypothetical protein
MMVFFMHIAIMGKGDFHQSFYRLPGGEDKEISPVA